MQRKEFINPLRMYRNYEVAIRFRPSSDTFSEGFAISIVNSIKLKLTKDFLFCIFHGIFSFLSIAMDFFKHRIARSYCKKMNEEKQSN